MTDADNGVMPENRPSCKGCDIPSGPIGPRVDDYHRRELPGKPWNTCNGCPGFRVHDWHYYYCRHLGDQEKPDVWFPTGGWSRLPGAVWDGSRKAPCGLPTIVEKAK